MSKKVLLIVSVLLVGILLGTSVAPGPAQAQDEPPVVTEEYGGEQVSPDDFITEIEAPKKPEGAELDGAELNAADLWWGVPGIVMQPYDSDITYANTGAGCIYPTYVGAKYKAFTVPLSIPDGAKLKTVYYTYMNNSTNPSYGQLMIIRTDWSGGGNEVVAGPYNLDSGGSGYQYGTESIEDLLIDHNQYYYWVHLYIYDNDQAFCGVQFSYLPNQTIFGLALPLVTR